MDLLKIREANIARNNEFLANLGLSPGGETQMSKDLDSQKKLRQNKRNKRKNEDNNSAQLEPTRRSSRTGLVIGTLVVMAV